MTKNTRSGNRKPSATTNTKQTPISIPDSIKSVDPTTFPRRHPCDQISIPDNMPIDKKSFWR